MRKSASSSALDSLPFSLALTMHQRLAKFCFAAALTSPKRYAVVRAMATSSQSTSCSGKALIFLHGLGDTPAGWSSLERQLPSLRSNLEGVEYVFPAAPYIPISINGVRFGTGVKSWSAHLHIQLGTCPHLPRERKCRVGLTSWTGR